GDDVAAPLSPSCPLLVRGISPAPQGQGGQVNQGGQDGHLLDQRGRTQANPGRDDRPAAIAAPCQDQQRQRRNREQVHEMFQVRSVTEEVGIGAQQGEQPGGQAGGERTGKPPADPPDQGDG